MRADELLTAFLKREAAISGQGADSMKMLLLLCWLVGHSLGDNRVTFPVRRDTETGTILKANSFRKELRYEIAFSGGIRHRPNREYSLSSFRLRHISYNRKHECGAGESHSHAAFKRPGTRGGRRWLERRAV